MFVVCPLPYVIFNCITDYFVITTVSLGVLHWTMQKNFARYVADVEMQKLDHLIANLGNVYRFIMTGAMPFRRRFYKLKERST
jgi:hypothetical protein